MAWPYHLIDLTNDEKHARRILLDRYGVYAQLSALVPIAAYQLYRLGVWVYSERQRSKVNYSAVPSSPRLKEQNNSTSGAVVRRWRKTVWWLEGDVKGGWGARGHWIAGLTWTSWLLFLCVHQTGEDYLHITKRFGVVAASQFPLHYALSMKSLYSPLALVFRCSHEQLNPYHRLSGRIIYFLLVSHATWYLNYFVQANVLSKRLSAPVVLIGITAFTILTTIVSSSLAPVRRWSYRVFFVLHLVLGVTILPLLWFHHPALRWYISEALALFAFDIVCRKLDTVTGFATISHISHTKLIKLKIPIPPSKARRFQAAPGQHVYLSLPTESTPPGTSTPSIHDLLFNPFTVADVSGSEITLVLRALNGPTTLAIENLAQLTKARPPINIEGPLGSSRCFPRFAKWDRVLLVAGGVGGTFVLPIYKGVTEELEVEGKSKEHVQFVWAMRSSAEASWAEESDLEADESVNLFITGGHPGEGPEPADGSVEMDDLIPGPSKSGDRPDLKAIVDKVFRMGSGERVAVVVCGPAGMAREVKGAVGRWVERGREVWFHDEGFGW